MRGQRAADPWRDTQGVPIPVRARVEQTEVDIIRIIVAMNVRPDGKIEFPPPGCRPRDRRLATGRAERAPRRSAPGGQSATHPLPTHEVHHARFSTAPARGWCCDIDGNQIPLFCQVEQVAEDTEPTVLPSRLHQHGQVVGRGIESVFVCFGGTQVIVLRPDLVRVLDTHADGDDAHGPSTHDHSTGVRKARDLGRVMTGGEKPMGEPPVCTGDPWIDAYLRFRQAFLDGATAVELTDFAEELKRGLPTPTPPPPAAMFIHANIVITCDTEGVPTPLVTALWVPG